MTYTVYTPRLKDSKKHFVRSGGIQFISTNPLVNLGLGGLYWSSLAYSDIDYAYYLYFYGVRVDLADYYSRHRAFPLRCLAS